MQTQTISASLHLVANGLERAYSGALIGSLLATAGIFYLAWRWFDRLTVRE